MSYHYHLTPESSELKQEILDAMIEENNYLDFVVKELEMLKETSESK